MYHKKEVGSILVTVSQGQLGSITFSPICLKVIFNYLKNGTSPNIIHKIRHLETTPRKIEFYQKKILLPILISIVIKT